MTENPVITFNPEDWNGTISQLMNLAAILLSPEDRETIGKNPEWDRPNYFLTDDEDDDESYFTVSLNYPLEEGETGPKIAINVMILFNKIQAYATPRNGGDSILAVEVPIDSTVARGLCIRWTVKAYPGFEIYFKVIRPPSSMVMVFSQSVRHLPVFGSK